MSTRTRDAGQAGLNLKEATGTSRPARSADASESPSHCALANHPQMRRRERVFLDPHPTSSNLNPISHFSQPGPAAHNFPAGGDNDRLLQRFQTCSAPGPHRVTGKSSGRSVDYHPISLAAFVEYNPRVMCLREYLYRVASFQETFHLRFRHKEQLPCRSSSFATGTQVIHDLQVLERMFRPQNVIAPSKNLVPTLRKLHWILTRIKAEVGRDFLEIQRSQQGLHASEFIAWVSGRYAVQGKKMKIRRRLFRHSPDALYGGRREIESAIAHYSSAEAVGDKTMTGVMADCIVNALQRYLAEHLAARQTLFEKLCCCFWQATSKKKQAEATGSGGFRAAAPEDCLVFKFPTI